jgi:2-methylcitrate dehydratase PrpD
VVGLEQFADGRFDGNGVSEAAIAALLPRIEVRVVPELTARYPAEWGTRLVFSHADGTRTVRAAAFPRGNPENPVSTGMLEEKLVALVTPRYDGDVAARALRAVAQLEGASDMASVFSHLAPARPVPHSSGR